RKRETQAVTRFTDSLISTFANQIPGLTFARNTALTAVQLLPPLKRFLLQRTMGLNRPSSRLAMGLPLNSTRD
ncbi:MAG: 2-octaprenyl-6-methoxyphenyl hydroxylase, partial [Gammaproteobacteria bacterium]|nr:2-octaprenyl-6-methoxyphenyl hydroxylase [Gammaproteobacteria bacterium]